MCSLPPTRKQYSLRINNLQPLVTNIVSWCWWSFGVRVCAQNHLSQDLSKENNKRKAPKFSVRLNNKISESQSRKTTTMENPPQNGEIAFLKFSPAREWREPKKNQYRTPDWITAARRPPPAAWKAINPADCVGLQNYVEWWCCRANILDKELEYFIRSSQQQQQHLFNNNNIFAVICFNLRRLRMSSTPLSVNNGT